tara:strand:+ start:581 stop:838 length:258 start_codon:yes stop_codon:yes gene_type:complete
MRGMSSRFHTARAAERTWWLVRKVNQVIEKHLSSRNIYPREIFILEKEKRVHSFVKASDSEERMRRGQRSREEDKYIIMGRMKNL